MARENNWLNKCYVVLAMLVVQVIIAGMQVLTRVIVNDNAFIFTIIGYSTLVAALCLAPVAFYFERGGEKNFGWSVWFWLFINASAGTATLILSYYGLRDTTATLATNFVNLIPIVTFFLSIITKMETINLRTKVGKVKTLGAVLCISGAVIASLYKGKQFYIGHIHHQVSHSITATTSHAHWTRGILLLMGSTLFHSSWFILQVKLLELFPFKYWGTMLQCIIVFFQSTVTGLCVDRHAAAWRLGWNLQLLTIIYTGAFGLAASLCLLTWAISKQGPTYPTMFNPLCLIFVAFSEALILGEAMTIGILLGMVLIIAGLYSFLWGKAKEMKSRLAQLNEPEDEEQENRNSESELPQPTTIPGIRR